MKDAHDFPMVASLLFSPSAELSTLPWHVNIKTNPGAKEVQVVYLLYL